MKPLLDSEGVQRSRRTDCTCGNSFQQSAITVEGWTDGGGPVEKNREVWTPMFCGACEREKLRAAAHQDDNRIGATP